MTTNEALEILIGAAILAQSKGVLSLDDAVLVKKAIETFKTPEEPKEIEENVN